MSFRRADGANQLKNIPRYSYSETEQTVKMQHFTWNNGSWQKAQTSPQSLQDASQFTYSPVSNQQPGMAGNSHQQRMLNNSVQPQQMSPTGFHENFPPNKQMPYWQTSRVPHQTVSSLQPPAGATDNLNVTNVIVNNTLNLPSAYPFNVNATQAATQQDFHTNSGVINPSSNSLSNMMEPNTLYPQQRMGIQGNQQSEDLGRTRQQRHIDNVKDPHIYQIVKYLLQNDTLPPATTCTTTTTSFPHGQMTFTNNSMSAITHKRQSAYNQYYKQNNPYQGLIRGAPPPYNAVSQSLGNNIIPNTINKNVPPVSAWSHKNQQQGTDLSSPLNNGPVASCCFTSKTNEFVDAQEQALQQQINRRNDHLHMACSTASDVHLLNNSSAYRDKQFYSKVPIANPNQNKQRMNLSVTENSNLVVPQAQQMNSRALTQKIMSRTQNSLNAPQQKPRRTMLCDLLAENGYGERQSNGDGNKTANECFFQNRNVSKRSMIASVNDASRSKTWPEKISSLRSLTKSSMEKDNEVLERSKKPSAITTSENYIQSSPGCVGPKAVAVVQPLSQESNQAVSNHASPEDIDQTCDKNMLIPSEASSNGAVGSSSDSNVHQNKQVCAEQSNDMQVGEQCAPTIQQSVSPEVTVDQNDVEDKGKDGNQTDLNSFPNLSSVPTTSWTILKLIKLIKDEERAQINLSDFTMNDIVNVLLNTFWGGKFENLIKSLRNEWYHQLMLNVKEFCSKNITSHSVILEQVKDGLESQPQRYYLLKDDEVYLEQPYKSSWLNTNEQVDDFEKEFGLPWSLKHHIHMSVCQKQMEQGAKDCGVPAQIEREMSNDVQSQSDLEPAESSVESLQSSTDKDATEQCPSPTETESVDSNDPLCSFTVTVLPPEEAKVIFKQLQDNMEHQPGIVINDSREDKPPEAIDPTQNDTQLEKEQDCAIEEICCISRWMQLNSGSNGASSSTCHCKSKENPKKLNDNHEKEELAGQKKDDVIQITKACVEEENQANLSQTNSNVESGHKCLTSSDKEERDTSQICLSPSQLSVAVTSDNKDEGLLRRSTEFDPEMESTGNTSSGTSVRSDEVAEIFPESESDDSSNASHLAEECGQIQLTLSDDEDEEQQQPQITTAFSLSDNQEIVERKRRRCSSDGTCCSLKSHESKSPSNKDPSLSEEMPVPEKEPLDSNVKKVQLVLYGSTAQEMCSLGNNGKEQHSPGQIVALHRPPERLSVNVSSHKETSSSTIPKRRNSVKQQIFESWKKDFYPTKCRYGQKVKTQTCTTSSFSGESFKRTDSVKPTNTQKLPSAPKRSVWNVHRNADCHLSLKKRRVLSSGQLKEKEQKKNQDGIREPEDQNGKNVLTFNVLPQNLSFRDGLNEKKGSSDPFASASVLQKEKDSENTVRELGQWVQPISKKSCLQPTSPAPKNSRLFHAFRKKYKEMTDVR